MNKADKPKDKPTMQELLDEIRRLQNINQMLINANNGLAEKVYGKRKS